MRLCNRINAIGYKSLHMTALYFIYIIWTMGNRDGDVGYLVYRVLLLFPLCFKIICILSKCIKWHLGGHINSLVIALTLCKVKAQLGGPFLSCPAFLFAIQLLNAFVEDCLLYAFYYVPSSPCLICVLTLNWVWLFYSFLIIIFNFCVSFYGRLWCFVASMSYVTSTAQSIFPLNVHSWSLFTYGHC